MFWHAKGWSIWQEVEQYTRRVYRETATKRSKRHKFWTAACGRKPVTGDTTKKICSPPSRKPQLRAQTDELPGIFRFPYNQLLDRTATKICRCVLASSVNATATKLLVRCMASCACAVLPKTTVIFSVRRIRFNRSGVQRIDPQGLRGFRFNDVAIKLALRPSDRIGSDETWDKGGKRHARSDSRIRVTWEERWGRGRILRGRKSPFERLHRPFVAVRNYAEVDYFMPERSVRDLY